ncbi:MAG: amidohydrolase family protein [Geminicoccaceae bacterium]|jgi:cytosine/adenosine deaminase-related metal-dependent hydrolase
MQAKLVRGEVVLSQVRGRDEAVTTDDGAVLVVDGMVEKVGAYDDLAQEFPNAETVGDGRDVVLPGFVNSHHHIGLTPVQLGSPDMPLELWFATRLVFQSVDLYLDTLYSAFEMIASGITTVQHLHGWLPGGLQEAEAGAIEVLRAYEAIGMRASYSVATRDQCRMVYGDDEAFLATLPPDVEAALRRHFDRFQLTLSEQRDLFLALYARYRDHERIQIQLAPANLHWCSDAALDQVAELSETTGAPMHMHLLETAYQKEYAWRRAGMSAVEKIALHGLLDPRMTIGHGVWLTTADVDRIADAGASICHNCSSNLRLRSGVGALNAWAKCGVNVGLGIDEAGINDDRDMLQEIRLALRLHRVPGHDEADIPSIAQILKAATEGGALTTPFAGRIGTLRPGCAADLVMIDGRAVSYPFRAAETPLLDAATLRSQRQHVRRVMIAGETVYEDGQFKRVDRDGALEALREDMNRALRSDEMERKWLAKAVLPHVRRFYEGWFDPTDAQPFYATSSRT